MYTYFTDKYNLKIIYSHQGYGNFIRLYRGIPVELFLSEKLNLKCKTTKNNVISSYKEDYFFDRKIREDRVLDALDRFFQN